MCHQTVGLVARAVEEAGITTLTMSVGRDITERVRPPRACFVNYPMGNEIGRPGDVDTQRAIVGAAFESISAMSEPGTIIDLPFELVARSPIGGPWQQWVYTDAFRRAWMKTRDSS